MKHQTNPDQLDFFQGNMDDWMSSTSWPEPARFPHNYQTSTVKKQVWQDLLHAQNPLIITGYATLDMVVRLLEQYAQTASDTAHVRILFGHEPFPPRKPIAERRVLPLSQEIVDHWLGKGISLYLSTSVLAAIEFIKQGQVEIRLTPDNKPMHAKIYQSDTAITLGSSNFSKAGLEYQIEANVRFEQAQEPQRFDEAVLMATHIWEMGKTYTHELLALLEQLLRVVTWQEALARACADILDGDWARRYLGQPALSDATTLWPSQATGIAQALWIIENVGSVLIADATGSGKTRMGARLIRSTIDRIWKTGRLRRDIYLLICPPSVMHTWEAELIACGQTMTIYSHGMLSNAISHNHAHTTQSLRQAQVLALDEAHGYLNQSTRTRQVLGNLADYTILFTATPVNRGLDDLLSIVDLLGADNFDDEIIALLEQIWKRKRGHLRIQPEEQEQLRKAIQRFTLRRTKEMLNQMVAVQPEAYQNRLGKRCRYPEHRPCSYPCQEPDTDCTLAQEIRETANRLSGIINLPKQFQMPLKLQIMGLTEDHYLESLLKSARGLAVYNVMDTLRSSRGALLEHLLGTDYVREHYQLGTIKKDKTGNILKRINERMKCLPPNRLNIRLPHWLSDPTAYQMACAEEIQHYQTIERLVHQISNAREKAKSDLLLNLLQRHNHILAFDRHVISLHIIAQNLKGTRKIQVVVASGSTKGERRNVSELFKLETSIDPKAAQVIALCSDAMSESINLQAASAVVHLDMPTVIRVAEQRVGRIDRMDSPHQRIEVYWPQDAQAFALRADERFIARHKLVEATLGSNLPLPKEMDPEATSTQIVSRDDVMAEERPWDGIRDAFEEVRTLVEGEAALVEPAVYTQLQRSQARVLSSVSIVQSLSPWAFFAIGGTDRGAPRWVYMKSPQANPCTDLDTICQNLRQCLGSHVADREQFDNAAAEHLTAYLQQLEKTEQTLLPRKKQRALDEMQEILKGYQKQKPVDNERRQVLDDLQRLFQGSHDQEYAVDWNTLAEQWLDAIRPLWYKKLTQPERKSKKPLRLKDLRKTLISQPLTTETLAGILKNAPYTQSVAERIVAAIIGIPSEPDAA